MKYFLLLLFFYQLVPQVSPAQTKDNDKEDLYDTQIVWGINKNSNGGHIGGVNLKFGKRTNDIWFRTLGLELVNVKHPQEFKAANLSGGLYIFGKTNYLYAIRTSYGVERVLSKKEPQQGIQISALFSGGPTIGLHAPYYIQARVGSGTSGSQQYISRQAMPDDTSDRVFETGRPLEGIFESDIVPGIHIRTGLSFEYGTFQTSVSGLEVGAMLEAYTKKIILLPNASKPNQSFFPSVYATLYFGSRR